MIAVSLDLKQTRDCYHVLRKIIPFWNCPGGKCLLTVENYAYEDVVPFAVVLLSAESFFGWRRFILKVYRDKAVVILVESF